MKLNQRTLFIGAGWAVTLLIAFFIGKRPGTQLEPVAPTPNTPAAPVSIAPSDTTAKPVKPFLPPVPETKPPVLTRGTVSDSNINEFVERKQSEADRSAGPSRPSTAEAIGDALSDSDPISRMSLFTEALQDLGTHNVQAVLQQFKDSGNTDGREFGMFLYAWAKFDGAGAMDYTKENNQRGWQGMQSSYSAMSGFAAADVEGAEAWARENFEGQDNPYLIGVINGAAKSDLQKASEITESLPYGRIRGKAVDVLLDAYFKEGNDATINWAANLEEGVLKNGIVSRVTDRLTRDDPQLAAGFVSTLSPGEGQNSASVALAGRWSRTAPAEAAAWAANLGDEGARGDALEETIDNWAKRDRDAAGLFLREQPPGPYLDGAIEEYAERLRFDDPVSALTWAATITGEDARHKLMEQIAEEWSERDPDAAAAFLQK